MFSGFKLPSVMKRKSYACFFTWHRHGIYAKLDSYNLIWVCFILEWMLQLIRKDTRILLKNNGKGTKELDLEKLS